MKANTDEMRRIATEINSSAVHYQNLINKMYTKFSNMSQTKEWVGQTAQEYVKYVLLDKNDMNEVGEMLKRISSSITQSANTLDNASSKARKEESL